MERRLTTILAADIVGYSRLMGLDEAGTLSAVTTHRKELIEPKAAQYGGRTVKLMGDGILMEFGSVVDAVAFAVEVQTAMQKRNAETPENRQIAYRIGINVGDIIVEGDDIHGDGVNMASRLEGLAEPGGICIRRNVRNQVRDKLDLSFEDLGAVEVKNIARPVRVFNVVLDEKAMALATPVVAAERQSRRFGGIHYAAAVAICLGLAAGLAWWQPWTPTQKPVTVERVAVTSPDIPSIAVLPFSHIGGEATASRLVDGITEDIITDLARFPEFEVVARNSTATYKNKAVDVREVGAALGVSYVLEGSIQRDNGRIRVTAQLIDSTTGKHLWSQRWDRLADDIFAVQTEISELVANQLGGGTGQIQQAERSLARRKRPGNLSAYELYLLGSEKIEKMTREDITESIRLLTQAVELDPQLARAWVELYHAHSLSRYFGAEASSAMKAAMSAAERAIALDPGDAEAHAVLGSALAERGEVVRAKTAFKTALRLAPNAFEILTFYAGWAGSLGEAERGAELIDRAIRLNPNYPLWAAGMYGWTYFSAGRYEDVLRMLDRLGPENYTNYRWVARAGSLAALGRQKEAEATMHKALERHPDLTIEGFASQPELSGKVRQRIIETMRLAGFPACARAEAKASLPMPMRLPECEAGRNKPD